MARLKLKAKVRNELGTRRVRRLRRNGLIPAVLYGDGKENHHLVVDSKAFSKTLRGGMGEHVIIDLRIEVSGSKEPLEKTVIVKEVQHDFLKDAILHIDFATITLDRKIVVSVPVIEQGDAVGVTAGGVLEHIIRELEIECLPSAMPEGIKVDVTELKIGDSIKVKDLVSPPGVTIMANPEITVVTVSPPKVEEVEAPPEEEELPEGEAAPAKAEGKEAGKEKEKEKEKEKGKEKGETKE
jgi:large subunit ribosomal protein L25